MSVVLRSYFVSHLCANKGRSSPKLRPTLRNQKGVHRNYSCLVVRFESKPLLYCGTEHEENLIHTIFGRKGRQFSRKGFLERRIHIVLLRVDPGRAAENVWKILTICISDECPGIGTGKCHPIRQFPVTPTMVFRAARAYRDNLKGRLLNCLGASRGRGTPEKSGQNPRIDCETSLRVPNCQPSHPNHKILALPHRLLIVSREFVLA